MVYNTSAYLVYGYVVDDMDKLFETRPEILFDYICKEDCLYPDYEWIDYLVNHEMIIFTDGFNPRWDLTYIGYVVQCEDEGFSPTALINDEIECRDEIKATYEQFFGPTDKEPCFYVVKCH